MNEEGKNMLRKTLDQEEKGKREARKEERRQRKRGMK